MSRINIKFSALLVSLLFIVFEPAAVRAGTLSERHVPFDPAADKATQDVIAARETRFVAQEFVATSGTVPYRLLSPAGSRQRRPLVLLLHGSGAIGSDNTAQLGAFAKSWELPAIAESFPAYVVVPQASTRTSIYSDDGHGVLVSAAGPAMTAIIELVDALTTQLPVDRSRIYVVGWSMGASASLDALMLEPRRFAATVAFSPVAPALTALPPPAPLMVIHGTDDRESDYAQTLRWCRAFAEHGAVVTHVSYDGMGHQVPLAFLASPNWREWLFAQAASKRTDTALRP